MPLQKFFYLRIVQSVKNMCICAPSLQCSWASYAYDHPILNFNQNIQSEKYERNEGEQNFIAVTGCLYSDSVKHAHYTCNMRSFQTSQSRTQTVRLSDTQYLLIFSPTTKNIKGIQNILAPTKVAYLKIQRYTINKDV